MSSPLQLRQPGYHPSGNCDWVKMLMVALPQCLALSLLLALLLAAIFVGGGYVRLFVPAFAGFLLGWFARRRFEFAHCRGPMLAAVLGFLLATIMFLGLFHGRFIHAVGIRGLTRLDYLPAFIADCMDHDVFRNVHDSDVQHRGAERPDAFVNGGSWVADWLLAGGVCAVMLYVAAGRAYCEVCKRWMVRKQASAPGGNVMAVVRAISATQIATLPDLRHCRYPDESISKFEVEYCPGTDGQGETCPIFFSAKEVSRSGKFADWTARQVPLTVDELAALSQKLDFQ